MTESCVKFTVSGVVQGVGFRYSAAHEGKAIGVTGYAKNLSNGDVEVVICGSEVQVVHMERWLEKGPRTSTVEQVIRESMSFKPFSGFKIL
ncbi:acylphosphatase [Vibrio sp. RE86]|uniref:acylphosphatase n=1 Tax=Vibrio sp. RE86 TaxID=2607605 RepID=UPI0014932E24|nr:acylphosphatase [Vibrio sp. RE86]NOH79802.1 acylphosphatase [Vibrio sp. RE86]